MSVKIHATTPLLKSPMTQPLRIILVECFDCKGNTIEFGVYPEIYDTQKHYFSVSSGHYFPVYAQSMRVERFRTAYSIYQQMAADFFEGMQGCGTTLELITPEVDNSWCPPKGAA